MNRQDYFSAMWTSGRTLYHQGHNERMTEAVMADLVSEFGPTAPPPAVTLHVCESWRGRDVDHAANDRLDKADEERALKRYLATIEAANGGGLDVA